MATTAPGAFDEFASKLELTTTHRNAIKRHRSAIEAYLKLDWSVDRVFFCGSHRRRTKKRVAKGPPSDVDLYVVLHSAHKNPYGGYFGQAPKQLLVDIRATLVKQLKTPT